MYQGEKKDKKTLGVKTHVCIIIEFQTQGTKPLGHQNCKTAGLSYLTWFTGKTGELRNGCFFNLLVERSGVLTLTIKLSAEAGHYNIIYNIAWTIFLVTWGCKMYLSICVNITITNCFAILYTYMYPVSALQAAAPTNTATPPNKQVTAFVRGLRT